MKNYLSNTVMIVVDWWFSTFEFWTPGDKSTCLKDPLTRMENTVFR